MYHGQIKINVGVDATRLEYTIIAFYEDLRIDHEVHREGTHPLFTFEPATVTPN